MDITINNSPVDYTAKTKKGVELKYLMIIGWNRQGDPMIVDSGRLMTLDTWLRNTGSELIHIQESRKS